MHWIALFVLVTAAGILMNFLLRGHEGDAMLSLWGALKEHLPSVLVMIVCLPIFVRDTFKLTNRFAGPMYRLRTGLQAIANEEPVKPIKFRDSDFWRSVADEYNRVLWRVENLERRCQQLERDKEDSEQKEPEPVG